jgi:predicted dehydrogenase
MKLNIAVDPAIGQRHPLLGMLKRIRGMDFVQDSTGSDGYITDHCETIEEHLRDGRFVLLLSPFQSLAGPLDQSLFTDVVVPGLVRRYLPSVAQIKRELDVGNLGVPGLLRFHDWGGKRTIDDQRLAETLDLAAWLFGQPPDKVYAVEQADYVQIHLAFENDGMAVIDIDANEALREPYQSLHLIGSDGAVYADDHRNMQLAIGSQGIAAINTTDEQLAWLPLLESFGEVIRARASQRDLWSQIAAVKRCVAALRRSLVEHQPISVEHPDG